MIFIERNAVPEPMIFRQEAPELLERLARYFADRTPRHAQSKPPFDSRLKRSAEVRRALRELFENRCAFCETDVGSGEDIEEFRPRSRAAQADRSVDPDHYWWLAYEWTNFYLCCRRCNYNKGTRFPTEKARAEPFAHGEELARESPMLLDPCRDQPNDHLQFHPDGRIKALTPQGEATIATFGLDREELNVERMRVYEHVRSLCKLYIGLHWPHAERDEVAQRVSDLLGSRRAHPTMVDLAIDDFFGNSAPMVAPTLRRNKKNKAVLENRSVWLTKIEIVNFKTIDRLTLEFPSPAPSRSTSAASEDERAVASGKAHAGINQNKERMDETLRQPWLMVLGENGVGKSTLLKAVALALMPAEQRARREPDAGKVITRGARQNKGWIRLYFDNLATPFELYFQRGHTAFHVSGDLPDMPVLGYGSTRLLSEPGHQVVKQTVSVDSLFDPRHSFADAEAVIAGSKRVSKPNFDLLASNLRNLLALGEQDYIARRANKLHAHIGRKNITLRELSDGYQSVMALAMDIMQNLSSRTFDMDAVEGLVLLDEIELHLHPRWKIQIVDLLRNAFPRVRFIASTHDPLCVHGLQGGELQIMTKHPDTHRSEIVNHDIPFGKRADEILTGPWFGISTTLDADTIDLMRQHSALLMSASEANAVDIAMMQDLEGELRLRLGRFGDTRADRIGLIAEATMDVGFKPGERDAITQRRLATLLSGKAGDGAPDA